MSAPVSTSNVIGVLIIFALIRIKRHKLRLKLCTLRFTDLFLGNGRSFPNQLQHALVSISTFVIIVYLVSITIISIMITRIIISSTVLSVISFIGTSVKSLSEVHHCVVMSSCFYATAHKFSNGLIHVVELACFHGKFYPIIGTIFRNSQTFRQMCMQFQVTLQGFLSWYNMKMGSSLVGLISFVYI